MLMTPAENDRPLKYPSTKSTTTNRTNKTRMALVLLALGRRWETLLAEELGRSSAAHFMQKMRPASEGVPH
jgi:hypothetical protein